MNAENVPGPHMMQRFTECSLPVFTYVIESREQVRTCGESRGSEAWPGFIF
jgi:hypothetical protein